MNERWRLEELVQLAGRALQAAPYEGQSSGRVRDVPDARTIRYYTTLGILDRPLEMRGRTAYYGRRHLLQIVAVKRLQARGMSLVEVQKSLAGADNGSLKRWAALPAGFWEAAPAPLASRAASPSPDELLQPPTDSPSGLDASGAESTPRGANEGSPGRARARFWAVEPAAAEMNGPPAPVAAVTAKLAVVLSLAPGVSLILEGRPAPPPDAAALSAIRPALDGLLASLARAGIIARDARDLIPRQTTPNEGADHAS